MTQTIKKASQEDTGEAKLYICPAIGCTNYYQPFGNGGRPVAGCSASCSSQAKREAGVTVIELDSQGGQS